MKKLIMQASLIVLTAGSGSIYAAGNIFNIIATGNVLQITSNIPNHVYPRAGIRVNTSGFQVATVSNLTIPGAVCTMLSNGFCEFSVSSTQPVSIAITNNTNPTATFLSGLGVADNTNVNVSICLNARGPLSCQSYTFRYISSV